MVMFRLEPPLDDAGTELGAASDGAEPDSVEPGKDGEMLGADEPGREGEIDGVEDGLDDPGNDGVIVGAGEGLDEPGSDGEIFSWATSICPSDTGPEDKLFISKLPEGQGRSLIGVETYFGFPTNVQFGHITVVDDRQFNDFVFSFAA